MFAIRRVRPLAAAGDHERAASGMYGRELRSFRQLRKSWYVFFFQLPWLPEKLLCARRAQAVADSFRMAVDASRFPSSVTDVYREAALRPGRCDR